MIEIAPHCVYERLSDSEVRPLTEADFRPRGGTALIDAVCLVLQKLQYRVDSIEKSKRPRIMIVIMTDGEENESRQFTLDQMRGLVAKVQADYDWKFLYLGANQDAFANTSKYGMAQSMSYAGLTAGATNALPFDYSHKGVSECLTSGAFGTRAWKADGNPSAQYLVGSAQPDEISSIIHMS
jgi:hypothetical protein